MIFKKVKRKTPLLAPNILLTNICNQNCKYCFAKGEMKKLKLKEMTLVNYIELTTLLKKQGINTIRIMGGEPTLHSNFIEIIQISLENFEKILIFTNGLIPKKHLPIINNNIDRIEFIFNLDTKAYIKVGRQQESIIKLIKDFSEKAKVNTGFTISDLRTNYMELYKNLDREYLSRIGIRIGYVKPIIGQKLFFNTIEYKQLGELIINLINTFTKLNVREIYLDCGLEKEMFTSSQIRFLKKNAHIKDWSCKGKWSSFDIASDLSIFPCFPYFNKKRTQLIDFLNLKPIEQKEFLSKKPCYNISD